jgi:hypothetical protein
MNDVGLYLQLFARGQCVIYVICAYLFIVVSNTYYVVFLLCLSSACVPPCCQFLWIVHFWLALRYSLPFMTNHWTFKMNNTTGASGGTGTAGPSSTPEFTLDVRWRSCGLISSFLNSVLWASFCSHFFGHYIVCQVYVW